MKKTPASPVAASGHPESAPPVSIFAPGLRSASVGATVLVAIFALEYIAVGTAMPTVAAALDGHQLYNMAFGATVAASVLGNIVGGWWSDRSGPRRTVLTGSLFFSGGLITAGLAPSMTVFVAGRGLQGLGMGLATVAVYVVIAQRIPDSRRPAVFSLLAAAWVLPGLFGPLLTGFLVEALSWRWVFLAVVPLVAVSLIVLQPALRSTRPGDDAPHLKLATIGWAAIAAFSAAGLNALEAELSRATVLVAAVAGVLMLVASWRLLPPGTLKLARGLPSVISVRGALGGSFIAAEAYLPLLLQEEHGYSPAQAGAVLAVASVTWASGSWWQGRLPDRTDRPLLLRAGTSGYTIAIAAAALAVWVSWPGWVLLVLYGVATFGVGIAYPTSTVLTLRLSPPAQVGQSSSALQVSESLASAAALAVAGVVFGLSYATMPHLAFTGTMIVAVVIGLGCVLAAFRANLATGGHRGP